MAPTCDWMIKIVKVNKLDLNSLLMGIVNRVSRSGTMKYQCENTDESKKKWLLTQRREGRVYLVQWGPSARSFSDIPAMKKSSADKTRLVSLGGRPETGAIRVFNLTLEWLQLMRILICFRSG